MAASRVHDRTLLILDLSDISKKYARKMEYLAHVHDGSEGEVGTGYWLLQVIGAETGTHTVLPLFNSTLLPEEPGSSKREHRDPHGDRDDQPGDSRPRGLGHGPRRRPGQAAFSPDPLEKRFLIRLRQDRHLVYQGRPLDVLEIARSCPMLYLESIIKEDGEKPRCLRFEFGIRPVTLPGRSEPLSLVVVRGFGEEPIMLLTNVPLKKTRRSLWWAVESYLTRWTIEETFRFIKQSYQLEDIRLLTYVRLQNMMALVLAAAYFTMAYLNLRTKLRVLTGHVLRAAQRVFGIPEFRFYALADGIKAYLFAQKRGVYGCFSSRDPETGQPWLFSP